MQTTQINWALSRGFSVWKCTTTMKLQATKTSFLTFKMVCIISWKYFRLSIFICESISSVVPWSIHLVIVKSKLKIRMKIHSIAHRMLRAMECDSFKWNAMKWFYFLFTRAYLNLRIVNCCNKPLQCGFNAFCKQWRTERTIT